MAVICIGDRIRCKDGTEDKVVDLHKYGNEQHVLIKTDSGEERDLRLSDYCKNWLNLFP